MNYHPIESRRDSGCQRILSIFAVLLGMIVPVVVTAQQGSNNSPVIHYNFLTGELTMPAKHHWHPPVHRPFTLQVDNVNRGAYRIEIIAKDSVIAASDPDAFSRAFTGLQAVPQVEKPKNTDTSATASDAAKKRIASDIASQSGTEKNIEKEFRNLVLNDIFTSLSEEQIKELRQKLYDNQSVANLTLGLRLDTLKSGNSANEPELKLRITIYNQLKRLYYTAQELRFTLSGVSDTIAYNISEVNRIIYATRHRYMTRERFNAEYPQDSILLATKTLRHYLLLANTLKNRHLAIRSAMAAWQRTGSLIKYIDYYKEVDDAELNLIDTLYKALNTDLLLSIIDKNTNSIKYLDRDEYFRFTSSPIIPFGDLITLKVNIYPHDTTDKSNPDDGKSFDLKLYTKYRFRLDFSTGIGGLHGLMDKSYRTETFTNGAGDVSGDSVLIFENSSRQQWNPVIAAFLHAGWDIGSAIKPAACIGLSINTATLDLTTVLVGGSLMLGRSDRFVLSGGWAFKKVNVLSGKFEAGKAYPKTDVGSSVPLENVFRSGGFVSLSYNLTNKPVQK